MRILELLYHFNGVFSMVGNFQNKVRYSTTCVNVNVRDKKECIELYYE